MHKAHSGPGGKQAAGARPEAQRGNKAAALRDAVRKAIESLLEKTRRR